MPAPARADVQGMTTYEHLVDATLAHGLMPLVVPELKTITLGGAITGLGIESSSFRNGMPHESVLEMDILTGDGQVVTARPEGDHADLFYGFPELLRHPRLRRCEPASNSSRCTPYVHLRHLPFANFPALVETLTQVCAARSYAGEAVDFIDGSVFSPDECYLTLGSWCDDVPGHQRLHPIGDLLPVHSEPAPGLADGTGLPVALGHGLVLVLAGLRGPAALGAAAGRTALAAQRRLLAAAGLRGALPSQGHPRPAGGACRPARTSSRTWKFPSTGWPSSWRISSARCPSRPFWLCPLRQRNPGGRLGALPPRPDVSFTSTSGSGPACRLQPGMDTAHHNRWVEEEVERLGGRKSLYSTVFYDEDRFWELYNGPVYRQLKQRYDPDGRLLDLYAKCVRNR